MSDCQQPVETGWNKKLKLCFWSGLYNFCGMLNSCKQSTQPVKPQVRCVHLVPISLSVTLRDCQVPLLSRAQDSTEIQPGGWLQHDVSIFRKIQNNCLLISYPHSNLQWIHIFSLSILRFQFAISSELDHRFFQSMEPTYTTERHFAGNWDHKIQHSADLVSN